MLAEEEIAKQELQVKQASNPEEIPWYSKLLDKASGDTKKAVSQDAFLHYSGKDPNKAVLSRRPLGMIMALSSGPFVEPARIAKVSGSPEWLVRAAIARNKGTPPNIVSKLAKDPHPLVQDLELQAQSPKAKQKAKGIHVKSLSRQRVLDEIRCPAEG